MEGDERVEETKSSLVVSFEAGGITHGVESSWAAIMSSILASPPVAYLVEISG